MRFRNKKINIIIRKGLASILAFSIVCGMLPAMPVKAADYSVNITESTTVDYNKYMIDSGYKSDKYDNAKDRIVLLSSFLHDINSSIDAIVSSKRDQHQTDKVKWNPSQKDIDDNRDLYLIQWTNTSDSGYTDPGDGFEVKVRLVYIDNGGDIRYSKLVNMEEYSRALLGIEDTEQWDPGRINQCIVAVPDDCKQIVGIFTTKESGGGNNNNDWWMDNFYLTRITSDKRSDVLPHAKNSNGQEECEYKNGKLVGFVSNFDIGQKYLGSEDLSEEWLYLFQTPAEDDPVSTGHSYYAQIVTGEDDLSGKDLKIKISYIDVTGVSRTYEQLVTDTLVEEFYPYLEYPTRIGSFEYFYISHILTWVPRCVHGVNGSLNYSTYSSLDYGFLTMYITMEVERIKNAQNSRTIEDYLKDYVNFRSYNWETANLTRTNLWAAMLFGNYLHYPTLAEDYLGPNKATDIPLNIPFQIKEITKMELSLGSDAGSATLQDVRIYSANPSSYTRTKMNGGMSTEQVFYDVSDANCLASIEQGKLIQLNNSSLITCSLNADISNQREHKLLQQNNKKMVFMDEDDNLGVQISMADLYDAGMEILKSDFNFALSVPDDGDGSYNYQEDHVVNMWDVQKVTYHFLDKKNYLDGITAMELFNLLDNLFKESLTLSITYKDTFGSRRKVEVPFITTYLLQLYSDNNGVLGTNYDNCITGIFQQGQDVALRVPLSQYEALESVRFTFGKAPRGIENVKNNKWSWDSNWLDYFTPEAIKLGATYEKWSSQNKYAYSHQEAETMLHENETFRGGILVPTSENFTIRAIRLYESVTKEEFHNVYDPVKRKPILSTTRDSNYYYTSKDKKGTTFYAQGSYLNLSVGDGSLKKGTVDYSKKDLENMYLVEISGQSSLGIGRATAYDCYITLSYTTTYGEEIKIQSQRLSTLSKDYNGSHSMHEVRVTDTDYEFQTKEDLQAGTACFTLELEDVERFEYIHISIPDGEEYGFQVNCINVYEVKSLSQRYAAPRAHTWPAIYSRDFTGERIAYNNKPVTLQPNREGFTFYFTKVNSDGTYEEPDSDIVYEDEYLVVPPTSMTYEETLKNLGLSTIKYSYTVNVNVADIVDAGSSNYFYFQLVFENGTSGVVLANQQLSSDSFRQGYNESFNINTTQNYGNVTAVRVICDTSSSTSQVFDKLNISDITVTLPSKSGSKSWIIDHVGWIDINYQDEGVATTVSDDGRSGGFPNNQVVKEFAKTRTASTASLLFTVANGPASNTYVGSGNGADVEAALTYVDTSGYTLTYNFNYIDAVHAFNESEKHNLFSPNSSDHFTLSINDIAYVKSLTFYRINGTAGYNWDIKDVSISQYSELGPLYRDTTGNLKRYIENETLLTTSSNSNISIRPSESGTFQFEDHSIAIDVSTNDPATWTTTITRVPVTSQESLNIYLFAGATEDRTYSFITHGIPGIKGRMEYTLKEGGSAIGSVPFYSYGAYTANGTKILKADGINITGMNQLKTLHLETDSVNAPIIAGAVVERIRGNTIVEKLYFDFDNVEMKPREHYSAIASVDKQSLKTKQTVALQVTGGQEQLFTTSSNIAVALLYTSEFNDPDDPKVVYSSPYIFFTDVGINSLDNTSILEVPFNISGVDEIAGISIISSGPSVSFENAVVYNYISNADGGTTTLDICQIAEQFTTSTVAKQLLKTKDSNVTPVTLTFTTSPDSRFPGAGTSGRLPLTVYYKTSDGKDAVLEIDNFSDLLPENTWLSSGSSVSFKVHLSNFGRLDAVSLSSMDDDWHLNKVSAEIRNINGTDSTVRQLEAFVDKWITTTTPVTAVFNNGNDSENMLNQIISFSVTGKTSKSGTVATATSGNILSLKAAPGESITFTPQVTSTGTIENTVVWDTSQYGIYMLDNGNNGLTLRVPTTHNGASTSGQIFSFTGYCSYNTQKAVTITVEIAETVPSTGGGGTGSDSGTGDNVTEDTGEKPSVETDIIITNGSSKTKGPSLPIFTAEGGTNQSYTIFVKPNEYVGTWTFDSDANAAGYSVSYSPATLTLGGGTGTCSTTMVCKDSSNTELFRVTFDVIVIDLSITVTASGNGITPTSAVLTSSSAPLTLTIPYSDTEESYTVSIADNHTKALTSLSTAGTSVTISNQMDGVSFPRGTTIQTVTARCTPINGTGQTFSVPITIKVAN